MKMTPEPTQNTHETTAQTTMHVGEQNVVKIGNKKIHFQATGIARSVHQQLDYLAEEAKGVIDSYYMFVNEHAPRLYKQQPKITVRLQYRNHVLTCSWRQVTIGKHSNVHYARHIPKAMRHRKFKELASGAELEKIYQTDAQLEAIRKLSKSLHLILRQVGHYSDLWGRYDKVTHEN